MMDLPKRIEIVPWGYWKAANYAVTRSQSGSALGGASVGADDSVDQKYNEWEILLDSGTWSLDVIYVKAANRAIMDFKIDGTLIGSIDLYNASTVYNNVTTFSGISIASAGHKILRTITNGHNASSTGYRHYIMYMTFRKTA